MAYMKRRLSDFMIPGPKSTLPNDGTSARDISQTDTPHHGGIPLAPSNDDMDTGPSSSQWPFYQSSGPDILQGSTTTDQDHIPTRITPLTYDPTLHRAGLLQPKSYNPSGLSGPYTTSPGSRPGPHQHSQNAIRLATMELSNMSFQLSPASFSSNQHPILRSNSGGVPVSCSPSRERITPSSLPPGSTPQWGNNDSIGNDTAFMLSSTPVPLGDSTPSGILSTNFTDPAWERAPGDFALSVASTSTSKPTSASQVGLAPPKEKDKVFPHSSGLTLLRPKISPLVLSTSSSSPNPPSPGDETPKAKSKPNPFEATSTLDESMSQSQPEVSERTPLLLSATSIGTLHHRTPHPDYASSTIPVVTSNDHRGGQPKVFDVGPEPSKWLKVMKYKIHELPTYSKMALSSIPAVLLGCLINVLDGVSYGMIIFPSAGVFSGLGPMGVSLFFVSTIISQLSYTIRGSGFAGANGSMMIEVVPFFHMIANSIAAQIGEEHPREIIATTLVAFSLSSILTGLSFFLLGALKLGVLVGFFPRHILVGCIGGVGAFLIKTGLTVSMRMSEEDFTLSFETLKIMILDFHVLTLWALPFALAILLRIITHRFHHQLIFPLYFIAIPVIFYIVVSAAGLNLGELRHDGWLFDLGSASQAHWYQFYSYFDYRLVRFGPLWSTLPTQFALLFFNVLHPPLNVPALAVSLNEDVDTNKELVAHGYSNLLSGLVGSVPNYLVYVNTLLFYRVGGGNRIAGLLLAIATSILLFLGTGPIAFIPVTVVGSLIFVLGIDLVKEALWDTRHRVSRTEYITIASIIVAMTVWDFVIGVLFGIVVSCFFFVVQNSQGSSVRAIYTGDTTMSAVRRPSLQRAYIREVAKQTTILRLQGFLFFGTITTVEQTIRELIEGPSWHKNPIQFLVVDLTLVAGVDMSSAEAFVRIQRLLFAKGAVLVFCGFTPESLVGKALRNVDVLGTEGVELFTAFNDAMEWTENAYLRSWYMSHKIESSPIPFPVPSQQNQVADPKRPVGSFIRSPRRSHLYSVGNRTIGAEVSRPEREIAPGPLDILVNAFSSHEDIDVQRLSAITKYFSKIAVAEGEVLWRQGDNSDGLFIVESGVLRAIYEFANLAQKFEECMVAGTVAGELSALSNSPRNTTCIVEHHATLWKMSTQDLDKLRREEPDLSAMFTQLVLKAAKTDYDILLSAIASRQ